MLLSIYLLWGQFYPVEFLKATHTQYSPTAMHPDAFNVLCISNCVDLYVSQVDHFILYISRHITIKFFIL